MGAATRTRPAAVESLLKGLVDYAGLFPPAAVSMADAVQRYDAYRRSASSESLGSFILPAEKLAEFLNHASSLLRAPQWSLSALGTGADFEAIREFNARLQGRAVIVAVETRAATVSEIRSFAPDVPLLTPGGRPIRIYVEVPIVNDPDDLVSEIRRSGLRAKVRTGGVMAAAFPTPQQLARFLARCAAHDVAFKATAGLHHPLRGDYPLTYEAGSARATMFGFLNVLAAAGFARAGAAESVLAEVLDDRDDGAFAVDNEAVSWRGHRLHTDAIREMREMFAVSVGSCSFTEPLDELAGLGAAW